nr:PREDICTED: uncharacterized protein LOC108214865 isoform X2 [Daucus carota subsp. sativus]
MDLPDAPMVDATLQRNSVSSEMVHSDTVVSANKKKRKKKRKRGENSSALVSVELASSEMAHSDAVISQQQGKRKKKKKKRKRGNNSVAVANVALIQQPIDGTGLVTNFRLEQRDVEVEDWDNIQKSSFGNSSVSNDRNVSGRVSSTIVTVPLQTQKTKRKKKKMSISTLVGRMIMPSTSVMGDSELMQHSAEQRGPEGIHLNECATKDKNCTGEDGSGIIDTKVDESSVSQGKFVGKIQGGKKRKRKIQGKNLNLEPKEGVISTNGLSEEQQVESATVDADQNASLGRMPTDGAHKKLLVLDLNGLLIDVVGDKSVTIQADGHVAGKKIFKRPFCEDFLQFCFEKFTVGIWSSRRKENVDKVLQVLMQVKDRSKLAFVWNQNHCTQTGFQTIENGKKPLFLKELSELWRWVNKNRKFSWKVRDYDKSNTLLLDDSPYKALKNPPHTAIFPTPYQYQDQNDNALGPGGDLRVYLEGLALAEDVQKYVEQNSFGQKSITDSDPSWSFYAQVIRSTSRKTRYKPNWKKSNPSLKNRVAPASKCVPV